MLCVSSKYIISGINSIYSFESDKGIMMGVEIGVLLNVYAATKTAVKMNLHTPKYFYYHILITCFAPFL